MVTNLLFTSLLGHIQLSLLLCGNVVLQVILWNNLSTFGIGLAKSEDRCALIRQMKGGCNAALCDVLSWVGFREKNTSEIKMIVAIGCMFLCRFVSQHLAQAVLHS